jgi:hypothetical protein
MSRREWLGPGLEIVSQRITRAVKSYTRDRLRQGQRLLVSWAVAGGLFVVAVLFALGIVFVGMMALFSFLRLHFGLFESYGLIAGLLFLLVLLLSGVAMWLLRRPASPTPALTSRLRVATHAPIRARATRDARVPTIPVPARSGLLLAAAAIVLTVAAVGRR